MRVVALLAAHNEERFVGACIENLERQGIATYVIDNESTDATVEIAARFELAGLETAPRHGVYSWRPLLERKEALAETLDADWFVHLDADEVRLPPRSSITLAEAIAEVDALGYNAIDFQEFTFVPTVEAPDHDHPRFQETMRHYYAYSPGRPDRLNAWKRQDERVDLAASGGHQVSFHGLNVYPHMFRMRHYLYLSAPHAVSKYVEREYDPEEVESGWHRRRAALRADDVTLLSRAELRETSSDEDLDASDPRSTHPLFGRTE
jgi:glycosyltransferase involved in cell wall biosynthesis